MAFKHTQIPNSQKLLINGSNPSLFPEVSNEETLNFLVVDGVLVPSHGRIEESSFGAPVDGAYKSDQTNKWYVVAGEGFFEVNNQGTCKQNWKYSKKFRICFFCRKCK